MRMIVFLYFMSYFWNLGCELINCAGGCAVVPHNAPYNAYNLYARRNCRRLWLPVPCETHSRRAAKQRKLCRPRRRLWLRRRVSDRMSYDRR